MSEAANNNRQVFDALVFDYLKNNLSIKLSKEFNSDELEINLYLINPATNESELIDRAYCDISRMEQ